MDGVHICQLLLGTFLVFSRRAYAFGIYGAEPENTNPEEAGAAMTVCMDVKMLVTYFVFQDTLIWTIKRHTHYVKMLITYLFQDTLIWTIKRHSF